MRVPMLAAATALISAIVFAQAPPVKMGLWEKKMVTDNGDGSPANLTAKSCLTPKTWQKAMGRQARTVSGCTIKYVNNAHGFSYSGNCDMDGGLSLVMNGSATYQDSEHVVTEGHSTSTFRGKKTEITSHSASHFISASCGNITPDNPEIESRR